MVCCINNGLYIPFIYNPFKTYHMCFSFYGVYISHAISLFLWISCFKFTVAGHCTIHIHLMSYVSRIKRLQIAADLQTFNPTKIEALTVMSLHM